MIPKKHAPVKAGMDAGFGRRSGPQKTGVILLRLTRSTRLPWNPEMRRRDIIAGLAGLAAWRSGAHAQAVRKSYRVGVLDTSARPANPNFSAFQRTLGDLGYREGDNLAFEYRSPQGRNETFMELASDLVRLGVDVIVTRGTPAALAAKAASASIPVVMAAAADPQGIVRLAPPSRNLTGFAANLPGAERKRVETLKQLLPNVTRAAALMNLSNPSRASEAREIEAAARALGIEPVVLDARVGADLERLFDDAARERVDGLLVGSDTVIQTNQAMVIALAASHRLPAIYTFRDFVEAGGLVSYGVSLLDLYRRAATYVDNILKGASPTDLPIMAAARAELVFNLRTARDLGLDVPSAFRARVDEAIE
jgi:putative ABC transport system substrate-binding protein